MADGMGDGKGGNLGSADEGARGRKYLSAMFGWAQGEPPTTAAHSVEQRPRLVATAGHAQRKTAKHGIKIFDAAARWRLHLVDEQIRELLCRHDSCSAGGNPGCRYPANCSELSRHYKAVRKTVRSAAKPYPHLIFVVRREAP
jgi:hypothetical protein